MNSQYRTSLCYLAMWMRKTLFTLATALVLVNTTTTYAEGITIPGHVWDSLTATQRNAFKNTFDIALVPSDSYGTILDAQTLNNSQPGNNAGSQLGAAVGSAAYVDNAFKGNDINYSAKSHLAAGIVGAMIGSALDTAPTTLFVTRYFVKLKTGNVITLDERKGDPFKLPVGVCVQLGPLRMASQSICDATKESFLVKLDGISTAESNAVAKSTNMDTRTQETIAADLVRCKVGTSTPIMVERTKCGQIEGRIIND